jgi:tRNA-dihydrouridine synthase A
MMEWTDRHCRSFMRLLSKHAVLYTEMVTTGALIHGDVPRHLDFDVGQHPVVLQLGGSAPADLASAARLGEQWGYDEINLNCGCPSPRVQRGAFGACLMAEPALVAQCVQAMREAVDVGITVKHRIGLGKDTSQAMVTDFVGMLAQAGVQRFIVHARNAWLDGLSPKDNREIPPLRYEVVAGLKRAFPQVLFELNGGLKLWADVLEQAGHFDGVMLGREAYHNPWILTRVDQQWHGATEPVLIENVIAQLGEMATAMVAKGEPIRWLTRHILGLCNGLPGAKRWRQLLSDQRLLAANDPRLINQAWQAVLAAGYEPGYATQPL